MLLIRPSCGRAHRQNVLPEEKEELHRSNHLKRATKRSNHQNVLPEEDEEESIYRQARELTQISLRLLLHRLSPSQSLLAFASASTRLARAPGPTDLLSSVASLFHVVNIWKLSRARRWVGESRRTAYLVGGLLICSDPGRVVPSTTLLAASKIFSRHHEAGFCS